MKKSSIVLVAILVVSTLLAFIGCKTFPPPHPLSVPARPNASFVTAKVLDVIQLESDVHWTKIHWEMVIEIQASEDALWSYDNVSVLYSFPPYRVGQTMTIMTSENVAELEKGQGITATVSLVGDEYYHYISATGIKKRADASPVPAAPKDSVVTAKVLDVNQATWKMVVEIQASEDVPGWNNTTKSRVGETITIWTGESMFELKGQVITASVQLLYRYGGFDYWATDIKKRAE